MEVNVTMTEEEYEDFRAYKQLNVKEYLKRQVNKNFTLLECLELYNIHKDGTGEVEFSTANNSTHIAVHCSSPRNFPGYINVDIHEYFAENTSNWIKPGELKVK